MTTTTLAEQIKALREKTGAGITDCKRALTESGGDFEVAVAQLRKKGLASAAKKSDRATKEGAVAAYLSPDGKRGAIIELNCETDFVAKTEEFQAAAESLAKQCAEGSIKTVEDADPAVKELVAKLGENMGLKRFERFELAGSGRLGAYIHSAGGKKGSMIELACESDAVAKHEAVQGLLKELGMQVVAFGAKWTNRADVPEAEVAKETEIFSAAVREEGKPEAAVPKIVEGKLNKLFFQAYCLSEQVSMRDNKTPLKTIIGEAAKAAGGSIEIKRFARYTLGGE
ncbi:MAG: translation elongation factor Ts [Elusimicrobia bacterium CG_4_10_14_0_2_um_filter_63_34]|nr:MAG: translation elongation factor Ts [Elusimicrobia bacterium CG_4_10_14_0_2_um_filter_63_34]